jgi:hypothetical protein
MVRWLLTPLATVALVVLLLQPGEQSVTDTGILQGPPSLGRDLLYTAGHIAWFGLLVVLWRWTLVTRFHPSSALVLAVMIALILGTSTEFAQRLIPNRGATVGDLLANGVGVVMGVVGVRYWDG